MKGFHERYFDQLTRVVEETEARTSAEIVVAIEPWSGSYRDVDLGVGFGLALVGLAALLYGPGDHPYHYVLIDVLVLFVLGAWLSSALPALRRAFTRPARRAAQVRTAAAAAFYDESVMNTRARTG